MSDYDGPFMTAAELRLEAELDNLSAYERGYDDDFRDYSDEYEPIAPEDCDHGDGSFPEGAGFECDKCDRVFLGPRQERADVWTTWPIFWVRGWGEDF